MNTKNEETPTREKSRINVFEIGKQIEEFAKQEAVGFAKWKKHYDIYWNEQLKCYRLPSGEEIKTLEDLFDLYFFS